MHNKAMTRQSVNVRTALGTIPQKLPGPNYQTESKHGASRKNIFGSLRCCWAQPGVNKEQKGYLAH